MERPDRLLSHLLGSKAGPFVSARAARVRGLLQVALGLVEPVP